MHRILTPDQCNTGEKKAVSRMETVERLSVKEMLEAKKLWSEIFFEDSERFTEYYFAEKMPENTGYGLKQDGTLAAMLFLTPYIGRIRVPGMGDSGFCDVPLTYIVGVGTRPEYRHRGYMDRLLRCALSDLHASGAPFTFLMPADPAIYTPYQFRYIYDRPVFAITENGERKAQPMQSGEEEALAAFMERYLEEHFQVFLKRDAAYYRRQKKESMAQNGDVFLWKSAGDIIGFYLYAEEDGKTEIQEAAADAQTKGELMESSEQRQPIIMARITDVRAMLSLLRLSASTFCEKLSIRIRTEDPLIAKNNGTFLWTVGKKESTIALLEKEAAAEAEITIEALTEFVFGRKSCRECFICTCDADSGACGDAYAKLSEIGTLSEVCLNEIV